MTVVCIDDKVSNCDPEFEPVKFMQRYTVVNNTLVGYCKCGLSKEPVYILAEMPINTYYRQSKFSIVESDDETVKEDGPKDVARM